MSVPSEVPQYAGMAALAGVGSLARGKQWMSPEGKFLWSKFITEAATAIGLAVAVIAAGHSWHIEPEVMAGLCVGAGWLGPATVSDLVLAKLGVKTP